MSNQTDIAWEIAQQKGKLVGRWGKDGMEYNGYYPTWTAYRDNPEVRMQTKQVQHGVNPRHNAKEETKLVSDDRRNQTKKQVKDYAEHWRSVMKDRAKPTGIPGVTHARTVKV